MSKVRINDLARELEVKSREILDTLAAVGVTEKKTHSSSLEGDEAERVRAYLQRGSRAASESKQRSDGNGQKPKIDWSQVSKPGDAMREILRRKEEASAPSPRPVVAGSSASDGDACCADYAACSSATACSRGRCHAGSAEDCTATPAGTAHCHRASAVGTCDRRQTANGASDCEATSSGGSRTAPRRAAAFDSGKRCSGIRKGCSGCGGSGSQRRRFACDARSATRTTSRRFSSWRGGFTAADF